MYAFRCPMQSCASVAWCLTLASRLPLCNIFILNLSGRVGLKCRVFWGTQILCNQPTINRLRISFIRRFSRGGLLWFAVNVSLLVQFKEGEGVVSQTLLKWSAVIEQRATSLRSTNYPSVHDQRFAESLKENSTHAEYIRRRSVQRFLKLQRRKLPFSLTHLDIS